MLDNDDKFVMTQWIHERSEPRWNISSSWDNDSFVEC